MEVNVSQQLKALIGTIREYEVKETSDILEQGFDTLVEGKIKLTRTNRGILVQGTLEAKIPVDCSRCLKIFDYPLTFIIEEEYFPEIDINTGVPADIPEEPGSFMIDGHHILDLNEAIRQNALLAVPMWPLCRKDCAGLCPVCGNDLNNGKCNCEKHGVDPRWSKLVDMAPAVKKKNKRKKETE